MSRLRTLPSATCLLGLSLIVPAAAHAVPGGGVRPPDEHAVAGAPDRVGVVQATTRPRVKPDENGNMVPDVRAAAAIIYKPITGEVLWEENSRVQRSIASITKVMTAIVFMESHPDLTATVTIDRADVRRASTTFLRSRERVTVDALLHLALIASDNGAARALARISPWGSDGFIEQMNEKAAELGLTSTIFADPSGLDADNVSSAFDLSRLITYAAGNERIAEIMRKPRHLVRTNRRRVRIRNTNKLLGGELDVWGGKTGFIRKAGYCLAALLQLPEGELVSVVVLGARSNAARFLETRRLVSWLTMRMTE